MIIISDPKFYFKSLNSSLSGVRSLRWKLGEAEETRSTGAGVVYFEKAKQYGKKITEGEKELRCWEGGLKSADRPYSQLLRSVYVGVIQKHI